MNSHTSSSNFHNYFPWCLLRWTIPNPCVSNPHPAGPSPQMFPMPGTGSWRQERVRGIHLSVEELIKITPALRLLLSTPAEGGGGEEMPVEVLARTHRPGRPGWPLRWSRLWKCSSEKREPPVMTMTASFLSNINIPAGSLFPPGAKPLFHFESSLWRLETFPWYFFLRLVYLLVSRWRANLSHQAQTAWFPRSRGQNNCQGRGGSVRVSSTKRLPRDGYSVNRGRDRGSDICISQKVRLWSLKRLAFFPPYSCMKWNPSGLRQDTGRLITSVQINFCDITWLTRKIWPP